jgi:hypothetical protein
LNTTVKSDCSIEGSDSCPLIKIAGKIAEKLKRWHFRYSRYMSFDCRV